MFAARIPLRSALVSPLCYSRICSFSFVQTRGFKKKWPADHVQLFANEYKHSNPDEAAAYQLRKVRYARKGLVAPRANDYDTDEHDMTEDIKQMLPEIEGELGDTFRREYKDLYEQHRREQKIAKDDPRSPYHFEDEEEGHQAAASFALDGAFSRITKKEADTIREVLTSHNKAKIISDVQPPQYGLEEMTSYLPEPDPVNYAQWDQYAPEFPMTFAVTNEKPKTILPVTPPKKREEERAEDGSAFARGARKNAVARTTIRRGTGKIFINDKPLVEYFRTVDARDRVLQPLLVSETLLSFDISIQVRGGGLKGQAGACAHSVSRALEKYDPNFRLVLKAAGLLTRDPRMVERKKPGKPKARKGFQWVKR